MAGSLSHHGSPDLLSLRAAQLAAGDLRIDTSVGGGAMYPVAGGTAFRPVHPQAQVLNPFHAQLLMPQLAAAQQLGLLPGAGLLSYPYPYLMTPGLNHAVAAAMLGGYNGITQLPVGATQQVQIPATQQQQHSTQLKPTLKPTQHLRPPQDMSRRQSAPEVTLSSQVIHSLQHANTVPAPSSTSSRQQQPQQQQQSLTSPEAVGQHISRLISDNEQLLQRAPLISRKRSSRQFSNTAIPSSAPPQEGRTHRAASLVDQSLMLGYAQQAAATSTVLQPSQSKNFQCSFCSNCFRNAESLQLHEQRCAHKDAVDSLLMMRQGVVQLPLVLAPESSPSPTGITGGKRPAVQGDAGPCPLKKRILQQAEIDARREATPPAIVAPATKTFVPMKLSSVAALASPKLPAAPAAVLNTIPTQQQASYMPVQLIPGAPKLGSNYVVVAAVSQAALGSPSGPVLVCQPVVMAGSSLTPHLQVLPKIQLSASEQDQSFKPYCLTITSADTGLKILSPSAQPERSRIVSQCSFCTTLRRPMPLAGFLSEESQRLSRFSTWQTMAQHTPLQAKMSVLLLGGYKSTLKRSFLRYSVANTDSRDGKLTWAFQRKEEAARKREKFAKMQKQKSFDAPLQAQQTDNCKGRRSSVIVTQDSIKKEPQQARKFSNTLNGFRLRKGFLRKRLSIPYRRSSFRRHGHLTKLWKAKGLEGVSCTDSSLPELDDKGLWSDACSDTESALSDCQELGRTSQNSCPFWIEWRDSGYGSESSAEMGTPSATEALEFDFDAMRGCSSAPPELSVLPQKMQMTSEPATASAKPVTGQMQTQATPAFIKSESKPRCEICGKEFNQIGFMRLHMNIHYFEQNSRSRSELKCSQCSSLFRSKALLQQHVASVHTPARNNHQAGDRNPRPFECQDCPSAQFRIMGHLAKHLRSKLHIQKLECLGKIPIGTYAKIEEQGLNGCLNQIDTTDSDACLASLRLLASKLGVEGIKQEEMEEEGEQQQKQADFVYHDDEDDEGRLEIVEDDVPKEDPPSVDHQSEDSKIVSADVWVPPMEFDHRDTTTEQHVTTVEEKVISSMMMKDEDASKPKAGTSHTGAASVCKICEQEFENGIELDIHLQADHIQIRDGNNYKCPRANCDKVYRRKDQLRLHIAQHFYNSASLVNTMWSSSSMDDSSSVGGSSPAPPFLVNGFSPGPFSPQKGSNTKSLSLDLDLLENAEGRQKMRAHLVKLHSLEEVTWQSTQRGLATSSPINEWDNGSHSSSMSSNESPGEAPKRPSSASLRRATVQVQKRRSAEASQPPGMSTLAVPKAIPAWNLSAADLWTPVYGQGCLVNGLSTAPVDMLTCPLCSKTCRGIAGLQEHLVSHSIVRPYVCDQCDAGFTTQQALNQHVVTHGSASSSSNGEQ